MSELKKESATFDVSHQKIAQMILNGEFKIKDGALLCPYKIVFYDYSMEIEDTKCLSSFVVLSFSKLFKALSEMMLDLFEKNKMTEKCCLDVLEFFTAPEAQTYAAKAYIELMIMFENKRKESTDAKKAELCYQLYMLTYSKLLNFGFCIDVDLFSKLIDFDKLFAKQMIRRLIKGNDYSSVLLKLGQSNDAKEIALGLVFNGYVQDWRPLVDWIDRVYGKGVFSEELELAFVLVLHRWCNGWGYFEEGAYKDVLRDVVMNRMRSVMTSLEVMHWLVSKSKKYGLNDDIYRMLSDMDKLRGKL
jgi:hypothetical protein